MNDCFCLNNVCHFLQICKFQWAFMALNFAVHFFVLMLLLTSVLFGIFLHAYQQQMAWKFEHFPSPVKRTMRVTCFAIAILAMELQICFIYVFFFILLAGDRPLTDRVQRWKGCDFTTLRSRTENPRTIHYSLIFFCFPLASLVSGTRFTVELPHYKVIQFQRLLLLLSKNTNTAQDPEHIFQLPSEWLPPKSLWVL